MPLDVVGISASSSIIPIVPFCPALEQNLSPIFGIRSDLILTFAILFPSSPVLINECATTPTCPFLVLTELSTYIPGFNILFVPIPITTVFSPTFVPSFIKPELGSK